MSDGIDLGPLKHHYEKMLREHGDTAEACSWPGAAAAQRNFAAIAQAFAHEQKPVSVYEVGCGLGAFSDFLGEHFPGVQYSGCDIVPGMIARAKRRKPGLRVETRDILSSPPSERYDYVVVSGLFNLRMQHDDKTWFEFVKRMLASMYAFAGTGLASNFLTSYVDWKRELGYYQDPATLFDFAQRFLSRFSEIRHSYYPWEFTLLTYREPKALPFAPEPVEWPPGTRDRSDSRTY